MTTTPTIIPSKEDILSTFDDLVAAGIISFGEYRTIKHDAGGYPVIPFPPPLLSTSKLTQLKLEFRICPAFARKPHTIGAKLDPTYTNLQQWGPGSDLFCPDPRMKLAQLNGTTSTPIHPVHQPPPQISPNPLSSEKNH